MEFQTLISGRFVFLILFWRRQSWSIFSDLIFKSFGAKNNIWNIWDHIFSLRWNYIFHPGLIFKKYIYIVFEKTPLILTLLFDFSSNVYALEILTTESNSYLNIIWKQDMGRMSAPLGDCVLKISTLFQNGRCVVFFHNYHNIEC